MAEFFAMGGYAAFVWPAYALATVVMIGLLVVTLRSLRSSESTLKALEGARPPRRRRQNRNEGRNEAAAPSGKVGAARVGEG